MTCDDRQYERLFRLLDDWCDGSLGAEQIGQLDRLLHDDPAARWQYLCYMNVHGGLGLGGIKVLSPVAELLPELHQDSDLPTGSPVLGFLGNGARWTREYFSQPGPLSILAATIFMVCVVAILDILPAPTYTPIHIGRNNTTSSTGSGTGLRPVDDKFKFVARITGLHNCRWSPEGLAPINFDFLQTGRELKLDSGLLQITYKTGAKVVLEGPVEFKVEKENACRLELGKLTAKVSEQAVGFTVETPTATICDLGTEFGVTAEQSGSTEVHIFIGEVEVQRPGRNGAVATVQRLKAGQAVRIDGSDGSGLQAIKLNERRFIREMSLAAITKRAASSAVATSTFDADAEGWTVSVGGSSFIHHATGGASGGYIQAEDSLKDDFFYFIAPEAFHGDRSRAYRSHLAFDLLIRYIGKPENKSMSKRTDAVVITGGGKSIAAGVPVLPKLNEWTHYNIPLCGLGHWRRVDRPGSPPASEQDILDVLSDINDLRIRGEFMGGKDTAGLDNVVLQRVK